MNCPTACVTCVWAGVDSVWEQKKLEARKMLENAAESHTSGARVVGRFLFDKNYLYLPVLKSFIISEMVVISIFSNFIIPDGVYSY